MEIDKITIPQDQQVTIPVTEETTHDSSTSEPIKRAEFYQDRYQYNGIPISVSFEHLTSLHRMRTVLHGVLYRGGVHREEDDESDQPLKPDSLIDLCEEGFGTAIYLPHDNFYSSNEKLLSDARVTFNEETGNVEARCLTRIDGTENTLSYTHLTTSEENFKDFIDLVYQAMQPGGKPIYAHCRGGMHRAGIMSAISLIQFCSLDNTPYTDRDGQIQYDHFGGELSSASTYWYKNAGTILYEPRDPSRTEEGDGLDTDNRWFNPIMERINDFVIFPGYTITPEMKEAICPHPDPIDLTNRDHFED
ncbi:MAG: hypothetical protein ABII18_12055 [bacterium]|nr:hypothetical protein [bacterium]MBU1917434.1 hypothetical protein [bacterium]